MEKESKIVTWLSISFANDPLYLNPRAKAPVCPTVSGNSKEYHPCGAFLFEEIAPCLPSGMRGVGDARSRTELVLVPGLEAV